MSDKSNAVTDDEFVEADELLASIPVEAEAMDLAEADGFMTAVKLRSKRLSLSHWVSWRPRRPGPASWIPIRVL